MPIATATVISFVVGVLLASQPASSQPVLSISPNTQDAGKFTGQEFNLVCSVSPAQDNVQFDWSLDGVRIHSGSGMNLGLIISSLSLSDAGHYTCNATLSNGTKLEPISAGTLTVFDSSLIDAPRHQYVVYGTDASLNCSFNLPGIQPLTTVQKDSEIVANGLISGANLDDEGDYICDIFIPQNGASAQVTFSVHVIVQLQITSNPPGLTTIEGNPPVSLTVNYTGRAEQNISVTWYKDGSPLPSNLLSYISTTYSQFALTGSTSLNVPSVQRKDTGVYRVVLETRAGAGFIPRDLLYQEISFQLDVTVPPAMPGDFRVEDSSITSVFARIRWSITNRTVDEGAETLTILLTYRNMSLVDQIDLPGDATSVPLDLIPGTEYSVRLRAENPNGMVITETVNFRTLTGSPKVNEISVAPSRESGTTFQVSTSLAYTGGGIISFFDVSYRQSTTSAFVNIDNVPATRAGNDLVWTGIFTISDLNVDKSNLQFLVYVVNEFNYKSNGTIISASPFTSTPSTNTPAPTAGDDALPPFWLFIIVAVLGTILVTITVVFACIFIVRCCLKGHKNKKNKYNVNKKNPNDDVEAGGNRYEPYNMSESNNMMNHSEPQPRDRNYLNTLHNGDSMPSIKTSSSSPTPQPDDHLLKKYNYINHQKYPSDASSAIKRGHTPSTTASSSPAPAVVKAQYEQRFHAENPMNGRSSISTSISEGFSTYGPQGNDLEIQNSQTESENVHTHGMQNGGSYPHHQSHISHGSQSSSSVPMYRTGTSTSNISMPSSIQSSHQSLVHGSGIFPCPQVNPLVYKTHVLPGSGGRAESICSFNTIGGGSISERGSIHPSIADSQLQTTV